jgi:hypothetical protein
VKSIKKVNPEFTVLPIYPIFPTFTPMKKLIFFALLLPLSFTSQAQVTIDTNLTELSRFIAGMDCQTETYKKLQEKASYKTHTNFTSKVWKQLEDSTLDVMVKWATEKNIMEDADTLPCMYTFSGPDFLFGNRFFPKASHYVLMGLEKCGSVTEVSGMKESAVNEYLNSIRGSMRYLLKAGYFVTAHMSTDFSKSVLNGNIHMMLMFMARENYSICSIDYGYMGKDSSFVVTGVSTGSTAYKVKGTTNTSGKINGMRVGITDSTAQKLKYVYYFSADIMDSKLKDKTEFTAFIENMAPFNSYFKAASYVPQHKSFAIIRNLILDNSYKILQDDTGVPLKSLDKTIYDIEMWGTYTKVISDLSWGYQPDLKKALEASGNNKDLPFRISYNGNYDEGMMLYAKRKK